MKLTDEIKKTILEQRGCGLLEYEIANNVELGTSTVGDFLRKKTHKDWWQAYERTEQLSQGPKILIFDIETAPTVAYTWSTFKAFIGHSQVVKDWYVLSWAAKWYHSDHVMYESKKGSWDDEDDLEILKGIWKLLDEADIVVTQNGIKFDERKLNARFVINGMQPPSSYRHIDTCKIAKKHFGFTRNSLEYMTDVLCKIYKKLTHGKYPGFELWRQCLLGNMEAWDEMEEYNKHDVLSLEELYVILRPYYKQHPNVNLYFPGDEIVCRCGSEELTHNGYHYTNLSKFDRFKCDVCGSEVRGRVNLLSPEKRKSLRSNIG